MDYKNSDSTNQSMAISTFKEMEKQLSTLRKDISFREYIGFEMCMKIFCKRYEEHISEHIKRYTR